MNERMTAIDNTKVMGLAEALEIVLTFARDSEPAEIVDRWEAVAVVEDFIVNEFGED